MGRPGELEGENGEREGGGGGSEGRGVSQKPPCFEARGLSKRLVPLPPPPRARTENPSALSQFPEATARRARGTPARGVLRAPQAALSLRRLLAGIRVKGR